MRILPSSMPKAPSMPSIPPAFSIPKVPGLPDKKPVKPIIPGDPGSQVDFSYMNKQLEDAKRGKARADQAYKALMVEHKEAKKQLEGMNDKINKAVMAQSNFQAKNNFQNSPVQTYSRLQRQTLDRVGLGNVSNRQSFGLAAITIALGITAIIGRVD